MKIRDDAGLPILSSRRFEIMHITGISTGNDPVLVAGILSQFAHKGIVLVYFNIFVEVFAVGKL